jgi:hypothetical protein
MASSATTSQLLHGKPWRQHVDTLHCEEERRQTFADGLMAIQEGGVREDVKAPLEARSHVQ